MNTITSLDGTAPHYNAADQLPITDGFVWDYWYRAQEFAVAVFRPSDTIATDTVCMTATDALLHSTKKFERLAVPGETDTRWYFWYLARMEIRAYVRARLSSARRSINYVEETEDDDLTAVALSRIAHSEVGRPGVEFTLDAIVDGIERLPRAVQAVLALDVYEQMTQQEVADTLGMARRTANIRTNAASVHVLYWALRVYGRTQAVPPRVPEDWDGLSTRFDAWVAETYGISGEAYLDQVLRDYRRDVSYVCDIIDTANGSRSRPVLTHRVPKMLPDATVRQIIAQHKAGVKQREIAQTFGVAPSLVSRIVNGKAYKHVE